MASPFVCMIAAKSLIFISCQRPRRSCEHPTRDSMRSLLAKRRDTIVVLPRTDTHESERDYFHVILGQHASDD
jgi:hypothetical protein